jgi:hypothetical protein
MEKSYIAENRQSRERLIKTINSLSESELQLIIYKEGWTIAVALGHIAFWDERRRILLRKWQKDGILPEPVMDFDAINDALVPFLLALAPNKAADMAVNCAEKVDKEIAGLSAEFAEQVEALGDEMALNRGLHRKMHLDEIDGLLKAQQE